VFLSDLAQPDTFHFTFRQTEAEAVIYQRLFAKNIKPYYSKVILKGIPLLVFAVVLVPTITALHFDKLPFSAVMMTELSFALGYAATVAGVTVATRRLRRDLFRNSRNASELFECRFEQAGVVVTKGTLVTRMTWDAISSVEDVGIIVTFWYDLTQGFFLPYHVFEDEASRIAFSTWAKDRVREAASAKAAVATTSHALTSSS
jgi:hypothetical protein